MSHANARQHFAASRSTLANAHAIEWEELPSLAERVIHRQADRVRGANDSRFHNSVSFDPPWSATMPLGLDPLPVSQPFVERLSGLATREVLEPDLYQHFFGPNADAV